MSDQTTCIVFTDLVSNKAKYIVAKILNSSIFQIIDEATGNLLSMACTRLIVGGSVDDGVTSLQIIGTTSTPIALDSTSASGTYIKFQSSGVAKGYLGYYPTYPGIAVLNNTGSTVNMAISNGGNVGIGTDNPQDKLHLSGSTAEVLFRLHNSGTGGKSYQIYTTNNNSGLGGGAFGLWDVNAGAHRLFISSNGNILLGSATETAAVEKLQVTGSGYFSSNLSASGKLGVGMLTPLNNSMVGVYSNNPDYTGMTTLITAAGTVNYGLSTTLNGASSYNIGHQVDVTGASINNLGVRIGTTPDVSGNWALYCNAAAPNHMAGRLLIGSTTETAGAEKLQVTGAIAATTTIKTGGYTVATLPTGSIGQRAYVTDALTPTWGAATVGGGAVIVPVFHNGTNWIFG